MPYYPDYQLTLSISHGETYNQQTFSLPHCKWALLMLSEKNDSSAKESR